MKIRRKNVPPIEKLGWYYRYRKEEYKELLNNIKNN